jgi:glycosyltransferase involved in cell wall biosynthesis
VYGRPWYTGKTAKKTVAGVNIKLLPSLHTKHWDAITHTFIATINAIWNKFDVIHYHGVGPALLAWIPRLFSPKTKVIITFHSIDRKHEKWGAIAKWFLGLGERATCLFADQVIAVSQTIEQYVRDVYDCEAEYIPNGVPVYEKTKSINKLKQWKIKPENYLLVVTRLIPHKGVHYILAAWKWLQKNQPKILGNKKLVIVGDGYFTKNYVQKLKAMAKNDQSIVFTGFQTGPTLEQLYSQAFLMIHSSDNEGLPINVLEAMAYGLPVLVSDIIEHRELINNPDYNFNHGDYLALAKSIAKLLKKPTAELKKQGQKNKRLARAKFDWEEIARETERVYCQEAKKAVEPIGLPVRA